MEYEVATTLTGNAVYNTTLNQTLKVDTGIPRILVTYPATGTTTQSNHVRFTVNDTAGDIRSGINLTSLLVTGNVAGTFNATADCTGTDAAGYTCEYVDPGFGIGGNAFTVNVKNQAGVSAQANTSQFDFNISGQISNTMDNYTARMAYGWNLMSAPDYQYNTSIEYILGMQPDRTGGNRNITYIKHYNGTQWLTWNRDNSTVNTLTDIEDKKGYWINTTVNYTSIHFRGYDTPDGDPTTLPTARSVPTGWQILGYVSDNDDGDTDTVLDTMCTGGLCSANTRNYNNLKWYDPYQGWQVVAVGSGMASDDVWDRSKGYLLNVTSATTYTDN